MSLSSMLTCAAGEQALKRERYQKAHQECWAQAGTVQQHWCPPFYDWFTCWNQTEPGGVARVPCPAFFSSSAAWLGTERHTANEATRYCTPNGTWFVNHVHNRWANYSACYSPQFQDLQVRIGYCWYAGYAVSIASLVLAVFIFVSTRMLRTPRTKIHLCLLLAFLANAVTQCVWNSVISHMGTLQRNPWWCRGLHLLYSYTMTSTYMWMFCEGLFLHIVLFRLGLCRPMSQHRKTYVGVMGLGWSAPAFPVIAYAVLRQGCVRSETQRLYCWSHVVQEYWWILAAPVIFLLGMNLVFFATMILTVVRKTRGASEADSSLLWKRGKAIFILTPILGVQYLMSSVYRPTGINHSYTFIAGFQYLNTLLTSLQGFAVALVLCFMNGEVRTAVGRRWERCLWREKFPLTSLGAAPTQLSQRRPTQTQALTPPTQLRNGSCVTVTGNGDEATSALLSPTETTALSSVRSPIPPLDMTALREDLGMCVCKV